MKTIFDLLVSLLERTTIAAARRSTTLKNLVIEVLEALLPEEVPAAPPADAIARLRSGYYLGGQPLTRDEAHARLNAFSTPRVFRASPLAALAVGFHDRNRAQTSGARELITEDLNHGQDYGGVRAINPFWAD